MIKKIFIYFLFLIFFASNAWSDQPKSIGKYKNWESFTYTGNKGKICFAQTVPLEKSPKNFKREPSRLFVTFRKEEKIKNEVSVTSGYIYKPASVAAKSGRNEFIFNQSKDKFAWIQDQEEEYNLIKVMKKASKLSISASTTNGVKTKELYSMMGFTKAYNTAKKSCA